MSPSWWDKAVCHSVPLRQRFTRASIAIPVPTPGRQETMPMVRQAAAWLMQCKRASATGPDSTLLRVFDRGGCSCPIVELLEAEQSWPSTGMFMWFFSYTSSTQPAITCNGSFSGTSSTGEHVASVCSSGGSSIAANNPQTYTPLCPSFQVVLMGHAPQYRLKRENRGFLSGPLAVPWADNAFVVCQVQ